MPGQASPGTVDRSSSGYRDMTSGVPDSDARTASTGNRDAVRAAVASGFSSFESYVNRDLDGDLRQFGYDIFKASLSSFEYGQALPVGPDYLLGPGDELRVTLWGKVNVDYMVSIDRDGKITLPELGVVHIAGLTFAEARDFLRKELNRYYKESEVKLNVGMGSLRSIRVFVVGKVTRPGGYTVSSLSTLINALFEAGGPSKAGSMRNIEVKRNGQTLVSFDLYDFLLRGDKTKDIRLMPEDVVFVPPVGPLVAVSGEVNSPAIYELKGESTIGEVIGLAGGVTDIAFKERVQISRVREKTREVVFESVLDEAVEQGLEITPGDVIRVFSVVSDRGVVRLSGAVYRSGEYGVSDGLTVKRLIEMAGGLRPHAYTKSMEITRVTPTQDGPVTTKISIDLGKAMEGDPGHDVPLMSNDYLLVRSVPEWKLYDTMEIKGEVRFPGTYTFRKGDTLSEIIERAGGFTEDAYLKGATFVRDSVRRLQQERLDESISRLEQEFLVSSTVATSVALTPEEAQQRESVMLQQKALIEKMRLARAKGRISIRLAPLDKFRGSPHDQTLEDGDVLTIPRKPAQVQVVGSVHNQTAFVYSADTSVEDYIRLAGGVTKNADEDEVYVLKADGTAVSRKAAGGWGISWDSGNNRWRGGGLMAMSLDPGDTVVVPVETEKIAWLREVKDITQILYQIAVTAGVLIVAF